jgi:hypothetical protein
MEKWNILCEGDQYSYFYKIVCIASLTNYLYWIVKYTSVLLSIYSISTTRRARTSDDDLSVLLEFTLGFIGVRAVPDLPIDLPIG